MLHITTVKANLLRKSDLCSRNCYFYIASYAELWSKERSCTQVAAWNTCPGACERPVEFSKELQSMLLPTRLSCRNAIFSHTGKPSAHIFSVALLSLFTPEHLHPQFYNSLECIFWLCNHHSADFLSHVILPSLCQNTPLISYSPVFGTCSL